MVLGLFLALSGCAAHQKEAVSNAAGLKPGELLVEATSDNASAERIADTQAVKGPYRPDVSWKPSYSISDVEVDVDEGGKLPALEVGADIEARNGKVVLREVVKGMARLKGMNVSWTSDVNQDALVDVNIKAKDDFWKALSALLNQLDYFYEFQSGTIVIKYKDTRRFFLPMPFLKASYTSSVGGDMLGSDQASSGAVRGTLSVEQIDNEIDLWQTVRENLDKILDLATTEVPSTQQGLSAREEEQIRERCRRRFPVHTEQQALCVERERQRALASLGIQETQTDSGNGGVRTAEERNGDREGYFYTIDKPLGIVTVTAPNSLLDHVEQYFKALKKEMSRQVIIEAKLVEVWLDESSQMGIDWSSLLKDSEFNFTATFGNGGIISGMSNIIDSKDFNLHLGPKRFKLVLDFLNEHGKTKVLANPKLNLLNGQPALITVGENVTYISNVSTTTEAETRTTSYTVTTDTILDGIGFAVMANMASDKDVYLQITPVASNLVDIEERQVGSDDQGVTLQLPKVLLRELTTVAKVKSGDMMIIGGLIDEFRDSGDKTVPFLGDIPGLGWFFKSSKERIARKELVILLQPNIVEI